MENDVQTQTGSQGGNGQNNSIEKLKAQQIGADSDQDRGGKPAVSSDTNNAQKQNTRTAEHENSDEDIDDSGDTANGRTGEEGNYGIDESGRTGIPESGTAEEHLKQDEP